MGKGDRKSKKGKINKGSYGVRRPKKKSIAAPAPAAKKAIPKAKKAAAKPKKTTKKTEKPAAAGKPKAVKAEEKVE